MGNDGMLCHYNQNIECEQRTCTECGWNPYVSEKRLEDFYKRSGIEKKDTSKRIVNAEDVKLRIKRTCLPMAEKGYSAYSVLVGVMKCIDQAEQVKIYSPESANPISKELKNLVEVVYCKECVKVDRPGEQERGKGMARCASEKSPCRGRLVKMDDFCQYGEVKKQEKNYEENN